MSIRNEADKTNQCTIDVQRAVTERGTIMQIAITDLGHNGTHTLSRLKNDSQRRPNEINGTWQSSYDVPALNRNRE